MLRHSGKGTDRTACSEKHNYLAIRTLEKKRKGKTIKGNEHITSAFPEPFSWVMHLPYCFKGQSWHSSCETFLSCSQHWGPWHLLHATDGCSSGKPSLLRGHTSLILCWSFSPGSIMKILHHGRTQAVQHKILLPHTTTNLWAWPTGVLPAPSIPA